MTITENVRIYWMSSGNTKYFAWIDAKLGRYWYVFQWIRGSGMFLYRSTDATPPANDNDGRWIFGRRVGARWS